MEWISVKDRMPENGNENQKAIKVLVAIKSKNGITVRTQTRFQDRLYHADGYEICWKWRYSAGEVTHWMPIPEPPREDT